jgi:hypothetical protein
LKGLTVVARKAYIAFTCQMNTLCVKYTLFVIRLGGFNHGEESIP